MISVPLWAIVLVILALFLFVVLWLRAETKDKPVDEWQSVSDMDSVREENRRNLERENERLMEKRRNYYAQR